MTDIIRWEYQPYERNAYYIFPMADLPPAPTNAASPAEDWLSPFVVRVA
jgi:hypothetical protein